MKKYFILSIVIVSFLFSSCTKDDDSNSDPAPGIENNTIQQEWNLIQVNSFFASSNFEEGDIVWNFNDDNTLEVTMNIQTPDSISIPLDSSGVYSYSILNTDSIILIAPDATYGFDVTFENGDLILSNQPELDGPRIQFVD